MYYIKGRRIDAKKASYKRLYTSNMQAIHKISKKAHKYTYIHIRVRMCIYVYTSMHISEFMQLSVHLYACVYVLMHYWKCLELQRVLLFLVKLSKLAEMI